jgi:hypothetical protein
MNFEMNKSLRRTIRSEVVSRSAMFWLLFDVKYSVILKEENNRGYLREYRRIMASLITTEVSGAT